MKVPFLWDNRPTEVMTIMAGRNNHPKNTGPMSKPSRLDQFGDQMADNGPSSKGGNTDASKKQ
jgi:hypothetical protein